MLVFSSARTISVFVTHRSRTLSVLVDEAFYVSLGASTIAWPDNSRYPVVVAPSGRRSGFVHVLAWEHAHGCRLPKGFVVHHLGPKRDARAERLELLDRKAHALIHAVERGKRVTARPGRVLFHARTTAPVPTFPRPVHRPQRDAERIEKHVAVLLQSLLSLLEPDEHVGNRIPPPRVPLRLAATPGEAALGLLVVVYKYDYARLTYEVGLAASDVATVEWLAKRVTVKTVIDRWTKFRRLPRYAAR